MKKWSLKWTLKQAKKHDLKVCFVKIGGEKNENKNNNNSIDASSNVPTG